MVTYILRKDRDQKSLCCAERYCSLTCQAPAYSAESHFAESGGKNSAPDSISHCRRQTHPKQAFPWSRNGTINISSSSLDVLWTNKATTLQCRFLQCHWALPLGTRVKPGICSWLSHFPLVISSHLVRNLIPVCHSARKPNILACKVLLKSSEVIL